MTKLKELVKEGFLLNNEEIYFDWNEFHFIARVRSNGDYLETELGNFKSISPAAGTILASIDNGMLKRHKEGMAVCNGWIRWKNWNGITLHELRKKLND